ncbi:MAG: chromosome segregation protein SMC [Clostridiales bacterium]|nr:chromosome segregation protein SMC [Clostridiales bacterium]
MVLKTLEMQGFKSFPDKTLLEFGTGITAVVGPNGSGKSNISDAIRWVLGEQRTKSLRGSNMEDVIFGGTSTRRAQGFAQVSLTLDNSDRTLRDKGKTVSISRRYYRSGESEYKIDGELVRRKDIRELFMDTGLGSNGYSMVGQGKIDSIISQKNEERRELFEEAAGISRFRSKRTDAQRRLPQAQENLGRLLDILKELEGRVEPLRRQSEKAAQFLELAGERKELEIGIWIHKINQFTQELREQERRIDAATVSYEESEQELARIEVEMEQVLADTSAVSVQIDELRRKGTGYDEAALKLDGEAQVLENTAAHNRETVARYEQELESSSAEHADLEALIGEKQALAASKEALIAHKRAFIEEKSQAMAALQSAGSEYDQKSIALSREISELTVQVSDYRVKQSQAQSSMEEIAARQDSVGDTLQEQERALAERLERRQASEAQLQRIEEEIAALENALKGYEMRCAQRRGRAEEAKQALDALNQEIQQKEQRRRMLSDLEKNMEGYFGAVKAVMRQARAGSLSGIHGPVSQLISVDSAYSVAVETALGAAMQHIVTDREADAKRAIYYLKQNRGGRATFLPISAIRGRELREKGLEDCLGFVDIASNLVSCDGKYTSILSNLLGKTVVCEDMDSAIGMAKQFSYRFRIVTLDGQVINAGGSMTGGSASKSAGILSRGNQIEQLGRELAALSAKLDGAKDAYRNAAEAFSKAEAEYQGAQGDLANAGERRIRAEGDRSLAREQFDSMDRQMAVLREERALAQGRLGQLEREAGEASRQIEAGTAKLRELEQALEALSGDSSDLSRRREEINTEINQVNLEILEAVKDQESAQASVADFRRRQQSQSGRLNQIRADIEAVQARNAEISQEIEAVKDKAAALRAQSEASKAEIAACVQRRSDLEKRGGELRLLERAKTVEREKLSTELGRLEERKNAMRKEYDDIINKLYDEYQLTRREAEEAGMEIENLSAANRRLNELKSAIRALGSVNVSAIEEYKEVSERYTFLKEQLDDIERSKKELLKIIDELTKSMSEKFRLQFEKINRQFQICFAEFFGGGSGELILEAAEDILESPIEIRIQPPGKSVQNINLFSGGEKSLAAMALLFAILKVKPAPFCIYDEVEAALDDVNVDRFAKYMRKMTRDTQFISITHRRGTMEEADILYGVTMQEKGVSKLLELKTSEMAAQLGIDN